MTRVPKRSRNAAPARPKPRLQIVATVLDIDTGKSYYRVKFRTEDRTVKTELIGREKFYSSADVVKWLAEHHAALPEDRKSAIRLVLQAVEERANLQQRGTRRPGWYEESRSYISIKPMDR